MDKEQKLKNLKEASFHNNQGDVSKCQECLVDIFDDNYYGDGYILIGRKKLDIESLWTNYGISDELYVHVNCECFEADVRFETLSKANINRVIKTIGKHLENID